MRRFVEALAAGRLNAKMVPEIEAALRELAPVVGLRFKDVRKEFEVSSSEKKVSSSEKKDKASAKDFDRRDFDRGRHKIQ